MRINSASISARGITGIFSPPRLDDLRVVLAHGGRDDDDVRIAHVLGAVSTMRILAPSFFSRRVTGFEARSDCPRPGSPG